MVGDDYKNKGYSGTWATRQVRLSDMVMSHPIHDVAIHKTAQRAISVAEMVDVKTANRTCPTPKETMVVPLSQDECDDAIGSRGDIWGIDVGDGKVIVLDGNGRSAAMKWAMSAKAFIPRCIELSVPVDILTPKPGKALQMLTLMKQKLYQCTDQGCHIRDLERFWSTYGNNCELFTSDDRITSTWMSVMNSEACLHTIADKLDDSAPAESYNVADTYGAGTDCHINFGTCGWNDFMEEMMSASPDGESGGFAFFTNHYRRKMLSRDLDKQSTYNVDCAYRDRSECADTVANGMLMRTVARGR